MYLYLTQYLTHVLDKYPHKGTYIHAYMDDIYTVHETQEEARTSHQRFTEYMKENRIPIQPSKSQIAVAQTQVLGMAVDLHTHIVSNQIGAVKFGAKQ